MKRQGIWGKLGIAVLVVNLIVVGGRGAWAEVPEEPAVESVGAPTGTLVVTSAADSGPSTLRQALLDAVNGDTITFDPAVFPLGSPTTIALTNELSDITQGNLTIDATGAGVILDGSACTPPGAYGFYITSNGNLIKGLQILNFHGNGIRIDEGGSGNVIADNVISGNAHWGVSIMGTGTMSNTVIGNLIGTDASGTVAMGNGFSGVSLHVGAQRNTIGGDTPNERNVISGNERNGIDINDSDQNTVSGNHIGTDVSGTAAIPNGSFGVGIVDGASHNIIGGDTPSERNVISGHSFEGVSIFGSGTNHNVVSGNYIGTDANGRVAIPNSQGIRIWDNAQFNRAGGTTANERNLLSGNEGAGVQIFEASYNTVSGNYVGINVSGMVALPNGYCGIQIMNTCSYNTIEGNVISGNNGNGVEMLGTGTVSNTVSGNYIGTDAGGTMAVSNTNAGVSIRDRAQHNVIGGNNATPGGNCTGECNLISGNGNAGVWIQDSGTMSNTVSGNYIGPDVNGTAAISNADHGIYIGNGASHNIIGGSNASPGGACSGECNLISGNGDEEWEVGVWIEDSGTMSNTVSGNYIGTDVNGTSTLGNASDGVRLDNGPEYNIIGGSTSGQRNLISGNGRDGVELGGVHNNVVTGNYIGTDVSGSVTLANVERGIGINESGQGLATTGNIIEGNLISGNGGNGIDVYGHATEYNIVRCNYIGTDVSGSVDLGNGSAGVWMGGGAKNNTIGGSIAQDRNIISGNNWGVGIEGIETTDNRVTGNFIGLDISGAEALGNSNAGVVLYGGSRRNIIGPDNTIAHNGTDGVALYGSNCLSNTVTHNSIYSNTDLGIDLSSGANSGILPPLIIYTDTVIGVVIGTACAGCRVEVFSDAGDEGRWYEDVVTATTSGIWSFTKGSAFIGPNVHATATDAAGNTSEFSGRYRIYLPIVIRQ